MGSLRYVGRSMSLEAESVLKNRPHRSINHDHLKATLDILKSMRYHRTEKKPWLDEEGNVIWSLGRLRVATFVLSQTFEMVMGLIILLNMVCIIIEANTDAECYPDYADDYSACPKRIVAGDAWGEVSWPLLELRPWTSIALFLIVVTISLGVLNLILAVIVESAAEARENDSDQKIKNKESERGKSMVELAVLCADLDKDASGTVSLDELFFGYDNLPQFKRLMEQMDIKRDEMELVFNVLNINGSGHIPYLEFCKSLGSFFKRDPIIMHSLVQCSIMDLKKLVQQEVVTSMKQQHEEILYEHRRILTMLHPHGSSTSCRNGTERPMCSSGHCENKVFAGSTVPPLPAQIPKISEPDLRSSEICEMLEQIDKEMNPLLAKVESLVAVLHVASPASTGIRGTSYFGESDKLALDAAVAHESLGERTLHLKGGYLDVQNAKLSDKLQRRLDDAELLKNRLANSIQLSLHIESGQVGLREVLSQPGSCKQPGSLDKENFALTP